MKVCVVTGASRGLGLEISKSLAISGNRVYALVRQNSNLINELEIADKGEIIQINCDIRDPNSIRRAVGEISLFDSHIDLLVNNAGIAIPRPFEHIEIQEWLDTIATNLSGVFFCSQFFISLLCKSDNPDIINISSRSGKNPSPNLAAYCASKFGLNGLTEVMQIELMKKGIRVSAIAPGRCATDFANEQYEEWHIPPTAISDAVLKIINSDRRVFWGNLELRPFRNQV